MTRHLLFCILSAALCLLVAGCFGGGGERLGTVSGTVTIDGNAAPNVMVQFSPKEGGRTSTGVTDQSGKYSLMYTPDREGAKVGGHRVTVTDEHVVPSDDDLDLSASGGVIPEEYRGKTLEFEVKSGANTFDIVLE